MSPARLLWYIMLSIYLMTGNAVSQPLTAQATPVAYVPGEFILEIRIPKIQQSTVRNAVANNRAIPVPSLEKLREKYNISKTEWLIAFDQTPGQDTHVLLKLRSSRPEMPIDEIITAYERDPSVEIAEPNYVFSTLETIPNEYLDRADLAASQ